LAVQGHGCKKVKAGTGNICKFIDVMSCSLFLFLHMVSSKFVTGVGYGGY